MLMLPKSDESGVAFVDIDTNEAGGGKAIAESFLAGEVVVARTMHQKRKSMSMAL